MAVTVKRRYVHADVDRWGNVRIYFWRGRGHRKVRMHAAPGSEQFDLQYHDLLRKGAAGALKVEARDEPVRDTLRWLCVEHFMSSNFRQLDARTQHVTKLIVERMFEEPIAPGAKEKFANCPLSHFGPKAVRILMERCADRPEAANNRLRRLRRIFNWAIQAGVGGILSNPARDVPRLKPKRAGGFPAWRAEDIEEFEARHPVGTKARLALTLLLFTGVRRSDVVRLGRQHMRDGMLRFVPHKGRNRKPTLLKLPVLPVLQAVLDATPIGDLTFLVTDYRRPFTAPGFTNWFRARCDEAGLKGLSAHGLRKAGAARAAENGATSHQLMAIFGWESVAQAEVYTKSAERTRLAATAMHLLDGTNRVEKFPTLKVQTSQVGKKGVKK